MKQPPAGKPLTFKKVYIAQSGWKVIKKDRRGGSGKIIQVNLVDERWRWQQEGHVSGRHNFLVESGGVPVKDEGGLFDAFTLKDGVELKTLGDLVERCVKQLAGKPQLLIEPRSGIFNSEKPLSVDWKGMTLAATALSELMSQFGFYITYTLNNNVAFWDYGDDGGKNPESISDEFLAQRLDISTYNFRPNEIEVVGGPRIFESLAQAFDPVVEFDQDAKGICRGDLVELPIACGLWGISFEDVKKAVLSWTKKEKGAWKWVEEEVGGDRGERIAKILQKCAFKWYKISSIWDAFLPWENQLPVTTTPRENAGKCRNRQTHAIEVLGTTFLPDDESDWDEENAYFVNRAKVDLSPYLSNVDYKNGVLKFSRPIGWLEAKQKKLVVSGPGAPLQFSSLTIQNAKKWNQLTKQIRDIADKNEAFVRAFDINKKWKGNNALETIIHNDIIKRLRQIALIDERARDAAVAALNKAQGSGDFINLEELELRAAVMSVTFASRNRWNKLVDGQSEEYYRFKLDLIPKKEDDSGGIYRIRDESLVEFFPLKDKPNTLLLDKKAEKLINAIFNKADGSARPSSFIDVNWEFYGAQRIETSGRVQQVAWNMSKSPAMLRTMVITRDATRGSLGRAGTVALPKKVFNRADLMDAGNITEHSQQSR